MTAILLAAPAVAQEFDYPRAQALLRKHCVACHAAKAPAAGLNLAAFAAKPAFDPSRTWQRIHSRVSENTMPPPGALPIPDNDRAAFSAWINSSLKTAACADGISPSPTLTRRLNRNEYTATVRDLLNIHINAGHDLPADGAGGEGFDNAAETLFLSPLHAEKYLEAARRALDYAAHDPRSRKAFLIATPNSTTTAEQAARTVLAAFLPRAFRRPARPGELETFLALFQRSYSRSANYEEALLFTLRGVLISPHFLFRLEPEPYALASRLSYFLWGTMPDAALTALAGENKLSDPAVLREQAARLLKDPKSLEFSERFVEQWLGTRELGRDIKPDAKLFPEYADAELSSAIRYEPILLFQEVFSQNLPLSTLLDARFTILTNKLQRHYSLGITGLSQQPKRVDLPQGSPRGGLLTMAATLAVSSLPHRTSPVLRGKWVLDSILGTPPPPPPPNIPELKDDLPGAPPTTVRERLSRHRADPVCAACHDRIDPIGFGLESYDVLGRWRANDNGKPIDTRGTLPDGTSFNGTSELKQILLARNDLFLRSLTTRLLGYALARSLTVEDSCAVDEIVDKLKNNGAGAHQLVFEIVNSVPFRAAAKPTTKP